jgi:hypothetical protein
MQSRSSRRAALLMTAVGLVAGTALRASPSPSPHRTNPVLRWNAIASDIFLVDPGLVVDSRAFAILHASLHDTVNAIDRRYQPYTADLSSPGASLDAAVAAAAHGVLVAMAPSQLTAIEAAYAGALGAVPDGPAKDAGVLLGNECAQANLLRRADDGFATAAEPAYVPTGQPGDYDFTPPFDQPPAGPIAFFPGWGRLTPFGISLDDHRLPGPQPLRSVGYALDFNYVKAIGVRDSHVRTDEQTEIAKFWFEGSPIGWNRIANIVLTKDKADAWKAARTFALVNFALADGYIAGFDAKYTFRFWRPYTAIRRAAEDGNPLTVPDETWEPLLIESPYFIPPVPDYPSTHTVLGAAAAQVLISVFGDHEHFRTTSTSLPGVTRAFNSFTEAAIENGLSRVYGGIHFVHAVSDGYRQGHGIGRAISRLLPAVRQ